MRTVWKGYLKVSLVTIPIKMYNAISTRNKIRFHLLHQECNSRIKQQNYCPNCARVVENSELVRGYEYGKDMYVLVTDDEIEQARKESTDSVEVLKFVEADQIQPIYYANSHYLVPDGKIGIEAFALFHRAMTATNKAALAKVVIRNREQLLSIRPYNGALIAYTLHYPAEIQDIKAIQEGQAIERYEVDKNGLAMSKTIIENLTGDFVPSELVDEYSDVLMGIIKAKAEGEEITVEAAPERAKVINLMEALEESVRKTQQTPKKEMAAAGKRTRKTEKKGRKPGAA
jgi:DNA end-binding protein Ku